MDNLTEAERILFHAHDPSQSEVQKLLTTIAELRGDLETDHSALKSKLTEKDTELDQLREKCEAQAIQLQFTNSNWPHEKKLHEELTKLRARNERLTAALREFLAKFAALKNEAETRNLRSVHISYNDLIKLDEALAGEGADE